MRKEEPGQLKMKNLPLKILERILTFNQNQVLSMIQNL